jgi:hypothetical protein
MALANGPGAESRAPIFVSVVLVLAALIVAAVLVLPKLLGPRVEPRRDPLEAARAAFAEAKDEPSFLAAASAFGGAGTLAEEDDAKRVAALALGGRPDLDALRRFSKGRDPNVARAIVTVYERALAEKAPLPALAALSGLLPPAELRARVAALWWKEAKRRAEPGSTVQEAMFLGTKFGSEEARIATMKKRIEGNLTPVFEAVGRALDADPDGDPWPRKLGPFFMSVKFYLGVRLSHSPLLMPAWRKAVEPAKTHPVGLLVRLCLDNDSGVPRDEVMELGRDALTGLERVKDRTSYVRAFAQELMNCAFNPNPDVETYERAVRLADYDQSWSDLKGVLRQRNLPTAEAERRQAEARSIPKGAWETIFFNEEEEDPQ